MVKFGDLSTDAGLKILNGYLSDRSYIEGYEPSQSDTIIYDAVSRLPSENHPHARRWFQHIDSFATCRAKFPGEKKDLSAYGATSSNPTKNGKAEEKDDDIDLFGSDEEDGEAAKVREQRLQEYAAKKSKKPSVVAKSSIILDCKPWDDETDMAEMEKLVRAIEQDGLVWGASKLVPVGYGIKKLQIMCVVEDEKVSIDGLVEDIQANEDYVQSVDIAAFNKI